MKLHEYQAKEIVKSHGLPVQGGIVAANEAQIVEAVQRLYPSPTGKEIYVVKAQIHAGGRGKGGGVKVAKSPQEAVEKAKQILGMTLITPQTGPQGKIVKKVLIAEDAYYPGPSAPKEFYFSITLDRTVGRDIVMASAEGGMEIEEVAREHPEKIIREHVDPLVGLTDFQIRRIAFGLGLSGTAFKNALPFIKKLYEIYTLTDASLLEINPMLKTSDDR
ncbi:MAG: ATP-grasp domain-containing protein, partial [Bacteroidia bacterium]|nr:succinate--CoA ligase subunit beta [Bacteroidia bacterium]MDW8333921.1 ATP-grasp domain-containing protein [Bacteroidia bacterium]